MVVTRRAMTRDSLLCPGECLERESEVPSEALAAEDRLGRTSDCLCDCGGLLKQRRGSVALRSAGTDSTSLAEVATPSPASATRGGFAT